MDIKQEVDDGFFIDDTLDIKEEILSDFINESDQLETVIIPNKYTKPRRFACPMCNYTATRRTHLNYHIIIHTGEKNFCCTECNYKASRKDILKRHMITHTEIRPFECHMCNYKARRSEHLKSHMKHHTKTTIYNCPSCAFKCTNTTILSSHINYTHLNAPSDDEVQTS